MDSPHVGSVTLESFERDVVERSHRMLVLVDFWASWCGPCQMLGPILTDVVESMAGRVYLATVNTEEEPELASRFQVQGIPAVKAFQDGERVGEFTGALPRAQVERFVRKCLPAPGQADIDAATAFRKEGRWTDVRHHLEVANEVDPCHPGLHLEFAYLAWHEGNEEHAEKHLARLVGNAEFAREAGVLSHIMKLTRVARSQNGSPVGSGCESILKGDFAGGFTILLNAIREGGDTEMARDILVSGFAILGPSEPLTREFRSALARLLY